jgi:LytS/YehU family sensor histidine kinase
LSRELAFLQRYLAVEQVRFEDRMEVVYEIEPGASQVLVPCLILQPIVENAVRHGIEARESAGQIRVVARRQGDRLHLEVADNGPGLPAGQPLREGIGLSNTRARLLHLHGAEQRLGLLPAEGGGLRVVLEMPWREAGAPTAAAEPGLAAPAPAAVGP